MIKTMDIDKFRIMHSTLIENYQYIEFHLEGIYAKICGKNFLAGLEDVEKHNIRLLVQEIRRIEKEKQISVFSDSDYEKLEHIRIRRNYWCHDCYVKMIFDANTDAPKNIADIKSLIDDLQEAELLRADLYQKVTKLYLYR